MMEAARWLVAFVAVVTAAGGLAADSFVPWSARQHIKNPAWPPHAKFHNGQSILMGLSLGVLTLVVLFEETAPGTKELLLAAGIASLYWDSLLVAPIFPGTAWTDPEFEATTPRPFGLHPQQLIAFVLLAMLLIAVLLTIIHDSQS